MNTESFDQYLKPGKYINSDHPEVIVFAHKYKGESNDPVQQAVSLYYAVRDKFMYNPFNVDLSDEGLKASDVLKRGSGYCVEKANLLAASARVLGIPSRIGLADVKNHIGSERLKKLLRSDVFACHGFTELYLNGKWVKATPAFNRSLCERMEVEPLPFNGVDDSIFQEFDEHGEGERKFMEYLHDHGTFADIPKEFIKDVLKKNYPHFFEEGAQQKLAEDNIFYNL